MVAPAILALALLSAQATSAPQADALPDVVVRGVAADPVGRFVSEVTLLGEHGRFVGQVARWGADLCVSVVGAVPEVNTYLTDQIAANFRSLDIPHAAPGCEPTVAVVVSMMPTSWPKPMRRGPAFACSKVDAPRSTGSLGHLGRSVGIM